MLERIVELLPAFDKRDTDPKKNYGVHGVELRLALKGPRGAVHFAVYTNWNLPHVQREIRNKVKHDHELVMLIEPMPADVGYHSPTPIYEGQVCQDNCPLLDGRPCYSDGSALQATNVFNLLLHEGSEGVWKELERRYNEMFT